MRPAHVLRSTLSLAFACALTGTAAAQTASVAVSPAAPTTDDVVVLTLAGQWPDSCVPGGALSSNLTRTGNRLEVLFRDAGATTACAAVVTPYSTSVTLGKLAAGAYQVDVTLGRTLQPSLTLGSGAFAVTAPQTVHLFVPSFLAEGEVTIASRLTAFNNGAGNATVGLVAAYDAYGRHDLSGNDAALAPGAALRIATDAVSQGAVRFVEVAATTHVDLRPALERLARGASEGRLPLPVFSAPFPAGSTVVAGDIRLFDGFQRANLTLFNASDATATVLVNVTFETGNPLGTRTVTLAPWTTQQVNGLITAADVTVGGSSSAWVRITADQPFLAYASATYEAAAPGAIPYEIYTAR